MDIARYIGLFLLKNQFCYIHGLGNMELKKMPAVNDGKSLQAASYEIVVTPGGSIDDNLANFIATNEQISISKAANTLREYSIQARKDMGEGKEVPIPGLGSFVEKNGKVTFNTDPNFKYTPASIPTIKNSRQLEEQNAKPAHTPSYPTPQKADSINWNMVILAVVMLIIVGGAGFGIWHYMSQKNEAEVVQAPVVDTVAQQPIQDTVVTTVDTMGTTETVFDSTQQYAYKWVISGYRSKGGAERRVANLALSNVPAEIVQQDSSSYFVVITVNSKPTDTAHIRDSLVRFFGYKEVTIYQ
jgi:hypothetical protein